LLADKHDADIHTIIHVIFYALLAEQK